MWSWTTLRWRRRYERQQTTTHGDPTVVSCLRSPSTPSHMSTTQRWCLCFGRGCLRQRRTGGERTRWEGEDYNVIMVVKCEFLYAEKFKMFIAFCFLSCYLSTFTITRVYAHISFFPPSPTLLPPLPLPYFLHHSSSLSFPLPCHFYHSPSCYSTTLSAMVLSVWWQVLESTSTTWKLSRSMSSEMNTARTRASMVSSGRREEELGRRIGGGIM